MAKSDLVLAQRNWERRAAQARAAGLADSSWSGLMQKDLQSVNQGHSPMADKEIVDAIRANAGLSPITDPGKSTGGPLDILGNIPSDIQSIVTGFVPGTVGFVANLGPQLGEL